LGGPPNHFKNLAKQEPRWVALVPRPSLSGPSPSDRYPRLYLIPKYVDFFSESDELDFSDRFSLTGADSD